MGEVLTGAALDNRDPGTRDRGCGQDWMAISATTSDGPHRGAGGPRSTDAAGACLWCDRPYAPRRGGKRQRFCLPQHRTAYYSAARRLVDHLVQQGRMQVAALHAPPATCTLVAGAISGSEAIRVARTSRSHRTGTIGVLWADGH